MASGDESDYEVNLHSKFEHVLISIMVPDKIENVCVSAKLLFKMT